MCLQNGRPRRVAAYVCGGAPWASATARGCPRSERVTPTDSGDGYTEPHPGVCGGTARRSKCPRATSPRPGRMHSGDRDDVGYDCDANLQVAAAPAAPDGGGLGGIRPRCECGAVETPAAERKLRTETVQDAGTGSVRPQSHVAGGVVDGAFPARAEEDVLPLFCCSDGLTRTWDQLGIARADGQHGHGHGHGHGHRLAYRDRLAEAVQAVAGGMLAGSDACTGKPPSARDARSESLANDGIPVHVRSSSSRSSVFARPVSN